MLSLRMLIVAGVAGICLWGLFELLDTLREPGLLRTKQSVAIKGCNSLDEHEDARRLCPLFVCQKALIDRKLVGLQAAFRISVDENAASGRLIAGRVSEPGREDREFACQVQGLKLLDARLLAPGELDDLTPEVARGMAN
ncbi:MAG TPA: hypothetical protein VIL28_10485 [Steroidobacteraceae bacterium]